MNDMINLREIVRRIFKISEDEELDKVIRAVESRRKELRAQKEKKNGG